MTKAGESLARLSILRGVDICYSQMRANASQSLEYRTALLLQYKMFPPPSLRGMRGTNDEAIHNIHYFKDFSLLLREVVSGCNGILQ